MSYEIHLIRAGHDRRDQHVQQELNPGPAVPSMEQEKQRLAAALIRFSPTLRVAEFDYAGLAASEQVDEQEARRRYRHIELNSDDYSGIQITLFDETVELLFPYWHSGEQAANVLRQVWAYLEVLQSWGSFLIYDPQFERMLSLETDFDPVLEYLASGSNSTYERTLRAMK